MCVHIHTRINDIKNLQDKSNSSKPVIRHTVSVLPFYILHLILHFIRILKDISVYKHFIITNFKRSLNIKI
jgi:hypothetical protein